MVCGDTDRVGEGTCEPFLGVCKRLKVELFIFGCYLFIVQTANFNS